MRTRNYSGYQLDNHAEVLVALQTQGITPSFTRVILEHVTHQYPDKAQAPDVHDAQIVGYAAGDGVEALLVEVDGTTQRPSGGHYHLTLSIDEGHAPKESNPLLTKAIKDGHLQTLAPIRLELTPF